MARFGIRVGPFYASTSSRRRRKGEMSGCGAFFFLILVALVLSPFVIAGEFVAHHLRGVGITMAIIALLVVSTAVLIAWKNQRLEARAALPKKVRMGPPTPGPLAPRIKQPRRTVTDRIEDHNARSRAKWGPRKAERAKLKAMTVEQRREEYARRYAELVAHDPQGEQPKK